MSILYSIFKRTPTPIQNIAITVINTKLYNSRHTGLYKDFRADYRKWEYASALEIENEANRRLYNFLAYSLKSSFWYKDKNTESSTLKKDLREFPILKKIDIVSHYEQIKTINERNGIISKTGGTTGASMKVVYTKENMQERFAILDHFRAKHDYKLGKKTAWFSGKNLISEREIKKGKCSHYDFINKIRFYSTFHIKKQNFDTYWKSLNDFKPEFIVGFPSSVYEICEIADSLGLTIENKVKVFFPTAETVLPQHREVIGRVLGCKLVDQYASSEGAPFILECTNGNLHIHPLTGIFEVVDENMQPATEGELLVTSFTTYGTPLIRYHIGDRIKLSNSEKKCECGSNFPLVDKIEGRTNDFIYSREKGKINLGNLSNSTKDVSGIICFQVIQEEQDCITLKVVISSQYNKAEESKFLSAMRERIGNGIRIDLQYVEEIPREKSGKFRIVKNNLKLDDL